MANCSAAEALAADYDVLRGSEPVAPVVTVGPATFTRWSGFYVGGDVGYNNANVDFTSATAPLITLALQGTLVEQQFTPSQLAGDRQRFFQRLRRRRFPGLQHPVAGSDPRRRRRLYAHELAHDGDQYDLLRGHRPQLRVPSRQCYRDNNQQPHRAHDVTDYGEARFRAGYIVGNLLPYGFIGMVVGSGDYSASVKVDLTCTNGVLDWRMPRLSSDAQRRAKQRVALGLLSRCRT